MAVNITVMLFTVAASDLSYAPATHEEHHKPV